MKNLSPDVQSVLAGKVVAEALGFRIVDFAAARKQIPRALLDLARAKQSAAGNPIGVECALVLRSLCASLLVLPAQAPTECPTLDVEEIKIADAIEHFKQVLNDRLGPPVCFAKGYADWELAASCYALALESEFRGPLYLGTSRARNEQDLKLGIWNFQVNPTGVISNWDAYLEFCKQNSWLRDKALRLTPPGLL